MSTQSISTLIQASQIIAIYAGSSIFIVGIIGGLLNIIVFLSLRTFREKSSAFYLTVMSFVNIGNLMTGLLSRIFISGFQLDWTLVSPFYCKFRWYGLQVFVLTSFTCTCLAAIDQYMSTSVRLQWRQWSNIKTAHELTIIFIIIWLLHGILYLIYFDLVPSSTTGGITCNSANIIFRQYHIYGYITTLACILPLIVTSVFGLLARHNVKNLAHRTIPLVQHYLDKQLTKMVLNQLLYNVIFTLPYTILTILTLFMTNVKDPAITARLDFANVVTILFYYLSFALPFYIYMCASVRFRQQLKYVLLDVHFKRWRRPGIAINQIAPTSRENP
ncbi:unnamed protein product [Rotaria sp. Silwood1]|nr:unnamed protein product [Rotaria sp. Silwood1]CAF3412515.1 unnamed protein product [Rotaria sp. Silwood1]CAF3437312.1 unnamed protein product [Rotaria sp. Silwood1]CAF4839533.1 unnamed protein product [Rotaria sp. Silwood1]CAF4892111.1 unnamed protein product [Rotaria sp. Silwood1]